MIDRHEAVTRAYEIPGQTWPSELCWLFDHLTNSRSHAEIGVFCGRSLFTSCLAIPEGEVFAADLAAPQCFCPVPDAKWLLSVQEATAHAIREHNPGVTLEFLREGSLAAALSLHSRGTVLDSVFIDGSHEYEHVMADIQAWRALVKPGGLICGHDYWPPDPGVMRAVNEVFGQEFEVVTNTRLWWAIT
ncbi:MAG: hypothetical protein JWM11_3307 [Planctomycetaceae bacterium]|nr:hypothetical protein [Planctomycetaceae bacterium]